MSILDFFKRDKSHNRNIEEIQKSQNFIYYGTPSMVPKEGYTQGLSGASNTVGTTSDSLKGIEISNKKPTTLEEYYEGAKNLRELEELYPSVSETKEFLEREENLSPQNKGKSLIQMAREDDPETATKKDSIFIGDIKIEENLSTEVDVKENISEILVQTCGKLPNSQGPITSTFEEFYEICIKNRLDTLENTVKIMGEYVSQLLLDVEGLQHKSKKIKKADNAFIKKPSIKAFDNDRIYSTPLGTLYGKDYIYKTTEAIIDVLENHKKELHMKDIFSKIKHYNLKNPNVNYDTVKSIVYSLVKREKIKHGVEYGCFKIIKSTKDI